MVNLALASIALATFSHTQQHLPAAIEASSTYLNLLQVAQEQIVQVESQDPDERNIDACLLAILLMGRYETATHRPDDLGKKASLCSLRSFSHHDGAMAVLKSWNNSPSPCPTPIVQQSRRGLIKSCLLRRLPWPDWLRDGERFGERGTDLDFDRTLVRLVNLHHTTSTLSEKSSLLTGEVKNLHDEAQALSKMLQDWSAQIPSKPSYQQHILSENGSFPRLHFYSSTVHSYSRPADNAVWSQYFSTKMLILRSRLKLFSLARLDLCNNSNREQQWQECRDQLKGTADCLASTIPFSLERFKVNRTSLPGQQTSVTLIDDEIKPYLANLAIWPLTIASSLQGIENKQQKWFRSELAALGKLVGDGVLTYAEAHNWSVF